MDRDNNQVRDEDGKKSTLCSTKINGSLNPSFEPDPDELIVSKLKGLDERSEIESTSVSNSDTENQKLIHPERQKWNSSIEFLLSCIALSVGLGNVWRFPFTAYENGGGAFLIPYIIVLTFIGRPMYLLELILGQFCSQGPVNIWECVPCLQGIGYGEAIGNSAIGSYYSVLIALSLYYLIASFQFVLPWTICHQELQNYNETLCIPSGSNATDLLRNLTDQQLLPKGMDTNVIGSAEEYFIKSVLKQAETLEDGLGYPDMHLTMCLLAVYIMIFFVLRKGPNSSGKVAYFTALFPYVILFCLLVRGVTLPGAIDGIWFYIKPQWSSLLDLNVWYSAVTQSFFSLAVGNGAIITFGSYNSFRHDTYRDALIISLVDTFTSLLAGFAIFSILGNLAYELDEDIDHIINDGSGLAFISYPMAIGKFTFMPQVFSVLFFLMLITLGMGSVTGIASGPLSIISDKFPKIPLWKFTLGYCIIGFTVGLVYVTPGGQQMLTLVDFYGGGFIVFIFAWFEMIGIIYIYGIKRLSKDIKFMLNWEVGIYWKFSWMIFTPFSLLAIFIYFFATYTEITFGNTKYPKSYIYFGYGLIIFTVAQLPFWFIKTYIEKKDCEAMWKPSEKWGPMNPTIRQEYLKEMNKED